jgi:SOS regulatory protein LexA
MDLNAEQKRIATQKPSGHQLLKGVAGSGKTSVGLYRAFFLLNNYCYGKDDAILLATYNRTLINYMGYLYRKMEALQHGEFQSLFETPDRKVDIRTIDSLMVPYFKRYLKRTKQNYRLGVPQPVSYEIVSEGITKLKKKFPAISMLDQKNVGLLLEEINWIKDCLYDDEEEYQGADRRGVVKTRTEQSLQRLQKYSDTRKAIYELMGFYDDEIRKKGFFSFGDMRRIALKQVKLAPGNRYTHVIIDESQDLTRSQLLFLKAICQQKDYSSIVFIADTAQNIYPQSWLGSGNSFASIGFSMQGRSYSLSKNFRTTTQISQAAYSLIENIPEIVDDENFVRPALIDKQGTYPVYKAFRSELEQANYLAAEIRRQRKRHPLGDMVIVCRFKSQLEGLQTKLAGKGITCTQFTEKDVRFDSDSVKLITLHSIKGLEFPVVFIAGLDEKVMPYLPDSDEEEKHNDEIQERKLFYVGMTRATESLYLSSSARPSRFIADIEPLFLRTNSRMRIRRFYNVPIDAFRYPERLASIHSAEEKVRQWVMAELVATYGYPTDCLTVEYPVKVFSKTGYVDVAVLISIDGQVVPFIFIETKRRGHSMEDALKQVQSYMHHSPDCCYGAATDGAVFRVIERESGQVNDLPVFRSSWGLSNTVRHTYRHLKTGRDAVFCFDPNEPTSMELDCQGDCELLDETKLAKVPVYGSIAAGQPLNLNTELDENVYLPRAWVRGADHFALKVKGDSMTGAQIDDGDIVVARVQSGADNLDIVVVSLGDEGTLKRFSKMGNNAILLAENPKYDPILLNDDQVNIIGLAVGVIKSGSRN